MTKIIRVILAAVSLAGGFFSAMSFLRAYNNTFDWHMNFIYPQWLDFGLATSALMFAACMAVITFLQWSAKPTRDLVFYRRVDFFVLSVVALGVVYFCQQLLVAALLTPWQISRGMTGQLSAETFVTVNIAYFRDHLITVPIVAYVAGIAWYMEFVKRARNKDLIVPWYVFIRKHPIWPCGVAVAAMLVGMVFLVFADVPTYVRGGASIALLISSFFAEFLLNLSQLHDKANAEKIQAERFKTELITNVSHDIKTPLTSIINYVDLLKNEGLEGQAAEHLQVLDRKSARLKILIDDLMEASKAGTGNMKVDLHEINLGELVGQIAGEFEDGLTANNLTLVIRQPEDAIFVETDSRHLYRVLENLFSNVVKYALGGTRVFVEIALKNGKPHIVVQNTSASPVSLTDGEATEQFMRGDKSRQTEGSGLGLYIAKSLVELVGGEFLINISGDLFRVEISLTSR